MIVLIGKRQSGHHKPAKDPIMPPDARFAVEGLARSERVSPLPHNTLAVVGVQNAEVCWQLLDRVACVLQEAPVGKFEFTGGRDIRHQPVNGIEGHAKALFAGTESILSALTLDALRDSISNGGKAF